MPARSMIAIIDNDFIAKITRIGLLEHFRKSLKRNQVTPTLQPSLAATFDFKKTKGPFPNKLASEEQLNQLIAFAASSLVVSLDDCGKRLVESSHLVEGIDPGDAIWLAAGACTTNSIVYTGDKNAMRAVSTDTRCQELATKLSGRVCCLEQYVLAQFEDVGYSVIRKGVVTDPLADSVLHMAMPEIITKRSEAGDVLAKYISQLRKETHNLLID